jgi:tetratricopeptide (TPR) repeat protein
MAIVKKIDLSIVQVHCRDMGQTCLHEPRSNAIPERVDEDRNLAVALNILGCVLQHQGNLDDAVATFRRGYELMLMLGDEPGQAMALKSLGDALQRQGNFDEVLSAYEKSIVLGRKLPDKSHLAVVYTALGRFQLAQRRPAEAIEALTEAFYLELGFQNQRGISLVARSLLQAFRATGDRHRAIRVCEAGLQVLPGDHRLSRTLALLSDGTEARGA